MTTANVTTTTYRSDDIVPFRRPQGDLDNRYMPQAYALVRSWASKPAEYGAGVLATYRQPVVNLGYKIKGTRVVLILEPVGVKMTDVALWPSLSIGEAMRIMQEAWQNIPELNP